MKWIKDITHGSSFATYYGVSIRRSLNCYYEFYCCEKLRFLRFDTLDDIKRAIRRDLKYRK